MTSDAAIDDADPLGRYRCPKCLYDRRGLPAGARCPECGYVLPAGVTVLNLGRVTESAWGVATQVVCVAIVLGMIVRDPAGTVHTLDYFVVMLTCGFLAAALRWSRIRTSRDAYVSQIWLAPEGIGLEADADRFSPGRPLERVATPLFIYGPLAIAFFTNQFSGASRISFWIVSGILLAVLAPAAWLGRRARRRARASHLDDIAPPLMAWLMINLIRVESTAANRVRVAITTGGIVEARSEITFAGGTGIADATRDAITRSRPGTGGPP